MAQAPLQTYASALIFAPTGSLTRKNFKTEEPDWISTKPIVEADWNACIQTLEGHLDEVSSVAFSPDGMRLASGSADMTIKIWDPASGSCTQTFQRDHCVSGRSVVSGDVSPSLRRLSSDDGSGSSIEAVPELDDDPGSVSITFSPDGQRLASGSGTLITIWDLTSGSYQILEGYRDSAAAVLSIAFSPDGQQLASGSDDNTIKIWDPASGSNQTLEGHNDWVSSVTFSRDGQRVASGSRDKTIRIWDPASGGSQTLEGHEGRVRSVAFSPDGRLLASGSDDRTIRIWDLTLRSYKGHSAFVFQVAFSPNSQRLASGSFYKDSSIKVWDLASGSCTHILKGHQRPVRSVAFSPNNQQLASGSFDSTVKIWDLTFGSENNALESPIGMAPLMNLSSNGQLVAWASGDQTTKIWDSMSGSYIQT